jgi:hypothetical protein
LLETLLLCIQSLEKLCLRNGQGDIVDENGNEAMVWARTGQSTTTQKL